MLQFWFFNFLFFVWKKKLRNIRDFNFLIFAYFFFSLIIDRDNQVSRKIFVSLHLFSFSFGTNSTFTFALGSFFSIIQILSQWKNRKKKKLDFNHRSIIYFLKFGGSSNYCVFFHTFRKVRILFIISTAAAKNLVFFSWNVVGCCRSF